MGSFCQNAVADPFQLSEVVLCLVANSTIRLDAGRIAPKNSPCARAASRHVVISRSITRVLVTSWRFPPASTIAASMISRHRLVCP